MILGMELKGETDEKLEWKVVRKSRKNNTLKQKKKKSENNSINYNLKRNQIPRDVCCPAEIQIFANRMLEDIGQLLLILETSVFFRETLNALESGRPQPNGWFQLVCYGLGSLSSSGLSGLTGTRNCLHQLVLACLLRSTLGIPSVVIFDPGMQEVDDLVLAKLGITQLQQNEAGKRSANQPTLFLMPHCPLRLYSNLLWMNWGMNLQNVFLLGNSFEAYNDRTVATEVREDQTNCVLRSLPLITEVPCPFVEKDNPDVPHGFSAFNDLSFMMFKETIINNQENQKLLSERPMEFTEETEAAGELVIGDILETAP